MRRFVSRPLQTVGEEFITEATGSEPPVPRAFLWEDRTLLVLKVLRAWRTSKTDRGDNYLKRHWYELETTDGQKIEVYYDREARRGSSRWWLYTIDE